MGGQLPDGGESQSLARGVRTQRDHMQPNTILFDPRHMERMFLGAQGSTGDRDVEVALGTVEAAESAQSLLWEPAS